jgi:hypothetical protein
MFCLDLGEDSVGGRPVRPLWFTVWVAVKFGCSGKFGDDEMRLRLGLLLRNSRGNL